MKMINISQWLYDLFGNNEWGMLLCIFLIFLLDALVFPTLPELFFAMGCMYRPTLTYGLELLGAAVLAEVIGIMVLYLIVSNIRIPAKIEKIATKYTGFLVLGDERLLLLNRVAPMIPFAGAFIAIMKWDLKKSLAYIIIGCVIKYGLILLMSNIFYKYFSSEMASTITLVFIILVIAVSFIISMIYKKKEGLDT
jgi:hypothetical protein